MMKIASDREFLAIARHRLGHLFPKLPAQPGYWKRRHRLAETIEWLTGVFAQGSPGIATPLCSCTQRPWGATDRSTSRRSELALACAHHYSRSHSPWFWVCACIFSPHPTAPQEPRSRARRWQERDVALRLFPIGPRGGEVIVCDKGYTGKDFERTVAERHGALVLRPKRQNESDRGPHLAPIRQRIESMFSTVKDPSPKGRDECLLPRTSTR